MKAKVMTIGPELARNMLDRNGRNRTVNTRAVARYANDMRDGKWTLNGEPIILDYNDDLLDGQHRLLAVIEYGRPVSFLVVTGAEPDVFNTIDIGSMRSGGDVLSIKGYKYAKTLAAILRTTHHFKTQGFHKSPKTADTRKKTQRRVDHLELVQKYPSAVDAAEYMSHRRANCSAFRPASFAGTMFVVFGEEDPVARNRFFDAIYDMETQDATLKPIVRLKRAYESVAIAKEMNGSLQYRFEQWDKSFRDFKKIVTPRLATRRLLLNDS